MVKRIAVSAVLVLLLLPITARALDTSELLAVVAMPLAVAAVSEVANVPVSELVDVVTLMNQADVPPAEFVEVVRYVPIALISDDDAQFVDFVRTQTTQGVRGDALVTSIEQRIRTYGVPEVELTVAAPRMDVYDEATVVPRVVREHHSHPHGGPPGQLKKVEGVQTGAEIVHRERVAHREKAHEKGHGKGNGKGHGHGKGHK